MDLVRILRLLDKLNDKYNTHTHFRLFNDHSGAFLYHSRSDEKFLDSFIYEFTTIRELEDILKENEC